MRDRRVALEAVDRATEAANLALHRRSRTG
jgi:hypothetical protein